jgi:hypothetical protein
LCVREKSEVLTDQYLFSPLQTAAAGKTRYKDRTSLALKLDIKLDIREKDIKVDVRVWMLECYSVFIYRDQQPLQLF